MKELEKKIIKDGKVLPGDILKIDNFLNHQIDVAFLNKIAQEFKTLFNDQKIDKILTIEASGIAIAVLVAQHFDMCPVVFAKKNKAKNMSNDVYSAIETSYTRGQECVISVSKNYLKENENVLILDDFLATGAATTALIDICNQAKAKVVGCGVVVSKTYQEGEKQILEKGIKLVSLARIKSMSNDGSIEFIS